MKYSALMAVILADLEGLDISHPGCALSRANLEDILGKSEVVRYIDKRTSLLRSTQLFTLWVLIIKYRSR